MGKSSCANTSSASANCNKLIIAKEKFCDDYFDHLVLETSRRVCAKQKLLPLQGDSPRSTSIDSIATSQSQDELQSEVTSTNGETSATTARPVQPKRPMNAFMVWGQAIRRELHHKFSNVQNALLSKALGRVWRALGDEEKEPYVRRANIIKANHKRDYPNYRYQPRRLLERRSKSGLLIGIDMYGEPPNQFMMNQPNVSALSTAHSYTDTTTYNGFTQQQRPQPRIEPQQQQKVTPRSHALASGSIMTPSRGVHDDQYVASNHLLRHTEPISSDNDTGGTSYAHQTSTMHHYHEPSGQLTTVNGNNDNNQNNGQQQAAMYSSPQAYHHYHHHNLAQQTISSSNLASQQLGLGSGNANELVQPQQHQSISSSNHISSPAECGQYQSIAPSNRWQTHQQQNHFLHHQSHESLQQQTQHQQQLQQSQSKHQVCYNYN